MANISQIGKSYILDQFRFRLSFEQLHVPQKLQIQNFASRNP